MDGVQLQLQAKNLQLAWASWNDIERRKINYHSKSIKIIYCLYAFISKTANTVLSENQRVYLTIPGSKSPLSPVPCPLCNSVNVARNEKRRAERDRFFLDGYNVYN